MPTASPCGSTGLPMATALTVIRTVKGAVAATVTAKRSGGTVKVNVDGDLRNWKVQVVGEKTALADGTGREVVVQL